MLKIAWYGDIVELKQIEPVITKYLTEKNIPFEINRFKHESNFLNDYFFKKDFQLLLICKNNNLSYIIKTYHNFDKNYMHMVSGVLELPLNPVTVERELISNIENTYRCPYGIYIINNRKVFHKILHEDIEYIQRNKNKSVIYLRNGETEEIRKSINKIINELNETYFVKCCKGYAINIFNINKVNKSTNTIELKSGAEIPLTRKNFQQFLKAYIFSMEGLKIWNN